MGSCLSVSGLREGPLRGRQQCLLEATQRASVAPTPPGRLEVKVQPASLGPV